LNYNKKIGWLIVLSSLLRMVIAGTLELGNDEVYYQTYSQHLQWNYFDHPPMVALLIRLSTCNLFFQHEFFIRLGSVFCAAAGTWMIFKTGSRLSHSRTGWIAAILYNTSFYTSIIAGTFILPDSPQVLCWLLSIFFMIRILEYEQGDKIPVFLYLLLGISIGACVMSKVHGVFLWLGFGAYMIFHRRDLLKSPLLWLSVAISMVIILPIYLWNLENHFITYQYHQERISFWGTPPDWNHLLLQILGSVFYNNPVNYILYIMTLYTIVKEKIKWPPKDFPLLLWLSLPLIGVLLWTSLFNEILPHWSGPAYLSLMLLAACWLDEKTSPGKTSAWLKTAGWVYGGVLIGGLLGIQFLPFRMGSTQDKWLGDGDITLDMTGWKPFAVHFDSLYQNDMNSGRMNPDATIISNYWFPAAHLDHYCGIPYHHNLLVMGSLKNIHHFAWLNQRRPHLLKGSDAYFIYTTNYYRPPDATIKNDFTRVEDSLLIPQYRGGKKVRNFVIYRMHDFRGDSLDYLIPGVH
jgi:hypothetical protein